MICVGIDLRTFENLGRERSRPRDRGYEVFDLKPQEYAIPIGLAGWIAHVWMFVSIPVMELKDERASMVDELLVLGASVTALAVEQLLIPTATRLDVSNSDQWLWLHRMLSRLEALEAELVAERSVSLAGRAAARQVHAEVRHPVLTSCIHLHR